MTMAETRAQSNRRIRQEALREQLAEQCRIQHIIENIQKMRELVDIKVSDYDTAEAYLAELSTAKDKASILNMVVDKQQKLLGKYLPDLKSTELTGDSGDELKIFHEILLTGPDGVSE